MNDLSIKEMKKIAHKIIESEEKEYNIKINIFPVTFIEYYKNYILPNKITLEKLLAPITAFGFNDEKGNTVIFLNNSNVLKKNDKQIFSLVETCFHEARHSEQLCFNPLSYEGVFREIEDYIRKITFDFDYNMAYDKYSFEIGANLCGITKTKEYLKENYPEIYEQEKEQIEKNEKKYKYDYMMYDASDTVNRLIKLINKEKELFSDFIFDKDEISPVLNVFIDDNNNFRTIKEIINHVNYKYVDKKTLYAFLSSQTFLNTLNIKVLSEQELIIVKEALEYTNGIYKNQQIATIEAKKEGIISSKEFLKSEKSIIKKISIIANYYNDSISKMLNITRNDNERISHIKNVKYYLNEITNNQIHSKYK